MPTLFLIPTPLSENRFDTVFPPCNTEIINQLRYFIVENIRTARRFIKKVDPAINIDGLTFFELNKHTDKKEFARFLHPMKGGNDVGLMSEAGLPAVADPGADIVALAQEQHFTVKPLVGPSSILLALMASGFNGQSFSFAGYLPIQNNERIKMLRKLESKIYNEDQSQIFIETPYRNMKMLEDILNTCQPNTKLCIAADITAETETIKTKPVKEWKKQLPDLHKRPCIFLLYK
jgi:16S rRNA (cytidine1402-2'-O)-methyltransferase